MGVHNDRLQRFFKKRTGKILPVQTSPSINNE